MLKQLRDPFGDFDIRLAPRHRFDILSIDYKDLEVLFQHISGRIAPARRADRQACASFAGLLAVWSVCSCR
jgi:hypothetical protein